MAKIFDLRPRLFEAGEVSITTEAFRRLKDAGIEPRQLIGRHTRGDWGWSESPARWLKKDNRLVAVGDGKHPIMSVYQMYPLENNVAVETDAALSKTSITNWPDGDLKAPEYPLESMEARDQSTISSMEKASFARSLVEGTAPKGPRPRQQPRGKGTDISR